ncbi:MAG: glycosyltransferase family A protein [Opitutaceae bacterium]
MSRIDLLVPCYNAAPYLRRLMDSVHSQTIPFASIICYDDGSSDDTSRVAQELGLEIVRGETNRGPAFARNRLIERARSDWVHFHDADDLMDPHFVEKMTALLTPEVDVAVCQMDWVTESNGSLEIAWRYDGEKLARDPLAANLTRPIGVIACVFRLASLRAVGGFDETLRTWEDANLQVRLSQAGARYRLLPEVLAIGMRHQSGASANLSQLSECQARLLETYADSLPPRYREILAAESEKLAAWLLTENMHLEVARRCLDLCRRLGWNVPSTSNPLLRAARAILPSRWLVVLQARHRRRKAS